MGAKLLIFLVKTIKKENNDAFLEISRIFFIFLHPNLE